MFTGRWRGFPLQLLGLTVLPLAVLAVAIAFGGATLHQRAMRSLVGERDERAARAAAVAIAKQLNHRAAAVQSLALQAGGPVTPEHALDDSVFFLPNFEKGLALFTADGQLLATSGDAAGHVDFWQTAGVRQALAAAVDDGSLTNDVHFLTPFTAPEHETETVLVAAGTADGTIAAGGFDAAKLVEQALNDVFGPQTAALVVRPDGTLLYQAGGVRPTDGALIQQPGVAAALQGESGTTYLTTEEGEHVVAFSPIAEVGWALVIEEPWHMVADPLLRTTEFAPLILVPVVVIALLGLWFGVRQIVQPLQSLAFRATGLAAGDFAGIEEPVGGIQEIRHLQSELILMADKVQLAQKSLRGYLGAVTTGQEEERRRLARELHDETIQSLIALNQRVQLAQMAQDTVVQNAPPPVAVNGHSDQQTTAVQLDEIQQMTTQVIADLRRLTRNLRPIYLDDLGLTPALKMLALDMEQALQIPIEFHLFGGEHRLSSSVELALYRIAQEALNNVGRHAQASRVELCLAFQPEQVILEIRDDGRGFATENPAIMGTSDHFGLLGMRERAELIGAQLILYSSPGEGTQISVKVPFAAEALNEGFEN